MVSIRPLQAGACQGASSTCRGKDPCPKISPSPDPKKKNYRPKKKGDCQFVEKKMFAYELNYKTGKKYETLLISQKVLTEKKKKKRVLQRMPSEIQCVNNFLQYLLVWTLLIYYNIQLSSVNIFRSQCIHNLIGPFFLGGC